MPAETSPRTLFEQAIAEALGVPAVEVKGRTRNLHEAGLAPLWSAPLTDAHKVNILLALMCSPSHAAAAASVESYGSMALVGTDCEATAKGTAATLAWLRGTFPRLHQRAPLRDFLVEVIELLRLDQPGFQVDTIQASLPPHEAFQLRIVPSSFEARPVTLRFAAEVALVRRLRTTRINCRIEQIQRCSGEVLENIALFTPDKETST